jgi:hypothetical protein
MIYRITSILKQLMGMDYAGRNFAVFPDDTMVVSYPRSGNTWTRFLIANLLHPSTEIGFVNVEKLVPDNTTISTLALKRTPRPRVIKTHEYFDHRYPKVVYIVRDPRDVVLSCYNFQRKYRQIPDAYPLEQYVDDFLQGRSTERAWGTWGENVGSWLSTRSGQPSFLLIRFEDMLERPQEELTRLGEFLGVAVTPEILERAISRSSAENMREIEKKQQDSWVGAKNHRKDIPFVGSAKAGGWKTKLPEDCVRKIESAWGNLMISLGYELATEASDESGPEVQMFSPASR